MVAKPKERTIVTDIDALIAESKYEPHRFTLGGAERELPHMRTLTFTQLSAMDSGEFASVLHEVAPDCADLVLGLPAFAMDAVVEGWFAHAGVNLGELLASANS